MDKAPSMVIEVTVISAEGLLVNRRQPVKKNAYVVVRSDPFNSRSTGIDPQGGSCPSWNEKLVMDMPMHARFITVEAHSGNKTIGSANIPVTEFSGGCLPENYLSFLSYRLRDANGEKNGIVNFSVKARGGKSCCSSSCARPWIGFPAENKASNGIVMGIPVLYS
ncbi:hypothetical protein F511_34325 [Dorcoceras hygrometricum]|uniref:C2 domain-containing protein n=1 Tax=Dorcoceras hygrometricum TaxID=472368 RepID=A0A2Z7B578_9LAMI|nr:hypothetical protein F511_34325 [Dorcoceras hygrometricum]